MLKSLSALFISILIIFGTITAAFAATEINTDGTETAIDPQSYSSAVRAGAKDGSATTMERGGELTYSVNTAEAGYYALKARVITWDKGTAFTIRLNGMPLATVDLGNTTNAQSAAAWHDLGKYYFAGGENTFTLVAMTESRAIYLYGITLAKTDSAQGAAPIIINSSVGTVTGNEAQSADTGMRSGAACSFSVNAKSAGEYKLYVSTAAENSAGLRLVCGGVLVCENLPVPYGDWFFFEKSYAGRVCLSGGENIITATAVGEIRLKAIMLVAAEETPTEEAAEFLDKINSAETVEQVKSLFSEFADLPFDMDSDRLFYPEEVYASLIGRDFFSFESFNSYLSEKYISSVQSPSVALYVDGKKCTKPAKGSAQIKISPTIESGITFAAAVYENNKLTAVSTKEAEKAVETVLDLGNIETDEEICKLFIFSDIGRLMPTDYYDADVGLDTISVYVAENGSDESGTGARNSPFASLKRAKEYVKTINSDMDKNIEVKISSGTYFIDEPLSFTPGDSASGGFTITYKGIGETKPLISGGVKVSGEWTEHENGIYKISVPEINRARQMYINGYGAQRAASSGLYIASDAHKESESSNLSDGFVLAGTNVPDFKKPSELEMVVNILWSMQRLQIEDIIKDTENNETVFLMEQPAYDAYTSMICEGGVQPSPGCYFYLENALELLDEEGEFYFDEGDKMLYYKPFSGEDLSAAEIYLPNSEGIIRLEGESVENKVSSVGFKNLDIRHGAYNEVSDDGFCTFQADCLADPSGGNEQRPNSTGVAVMSQLSVKNADNITIEGCNFSNLGSAAIGMHEGVTNSTVSKNVIKDISATGIIIGDWKTNKVSLKEQLCESITVSNNIITRCGQEFVGSVGIGIYYAKDVSICNNDISDLPYTGITVGWGWSSSAAIMPYAGGHTISANRIKNVAIETVDGGPIYTLGNLNGTHIAGNYITTSRGLAAIYLDTGSAEITAENNVVENTDGRNWFFKNTILKNSDGSLLEGCGVNTVIKNNYVLEDIKRVPSPDAEGSTVSDGIVRAGEVWEGEALLIVNNAGIESAYKKDVAIAAYPEGKKTVYDYIPRGEHLAEGEYIIQAESYTSYVTNDGLAPTVFSQDPRFPVVGAWEAGESLTYAAEISEAGTYTVELRYCTGPTAITSYKNKASVYVNGEESAQIANAELSDTLTAWSRHVSRKIGSIRLNEGENTITVKNNVGSISVDSIKLTYNK